MQFEYIVTDKKNMDFTILKNRDISTFKLLGKESYQSEFDYDNHDDYFDPPQDGSCMATKPNCFVFWGQLSVYHAVSCILIATSLVVMLFSLSHTQVKEDQRVFLSHRCYSDSRPENDLHGCKTALESFAGIEVDVRWNLNTSSWNNESFWLHHDDAELSTSKLVDLLQLLRNEYSHKYVYLDCKFKKLDKNVSDLVFGHFLRILDEYRLSSSRVIVDWNTKTDLSIRYRSVVHGANNADVFVETMWDYWFKHFFIYPSKFTILFFQGGNEFLLWIPCFTSSIFDSGVDIILWRKLPHPNKGCNGLYPSLFAWKWLMYTLAICFVIESIYFLILFFGKLSSYIWTID